MLGRWEEEGEGRGGVQGAAGPVRRHKRKTIFTRQIQRSAEAYIHVCFDERREKCKKKKNIWFVKIYIPKIHRHTLIGNETPPKNCVTFIY